MKLTQVRVREFQSVRDSSPFNVDDITCLVGKNEAGKTAILQAIYRVKPIVEADEGYSVTDHYPRSDVSDYEIDVEQGDREHATVATLTYELESDDAAAVEEMFGPKALRSKAIEVSRSYDGPRCISVSLDVPSALQHFLDQFDFPAGPKAELLASKTPQAVKQVAEAMEDSEAKGQVVQLMDRILKEGSLNLFVIRKLLDPRIPEFLYFDEYYQMRGQDNIEALKDRVANKKLEPYDHPLLGLIRKAGLDLHAMTQPGSTRDLKNRLEGAGNRLTKSIVKYWSQNRHLKLLFDVRTAQPDDPAGMTSGTNIWADVYDKVHEVTTGLGTRSRGFVWFFSFLAWYDDVRRKGDNIILLLDEPGTSLHGRAQGDLLRYFEDELAPNHQVIYTTHSPFMVDPSRIDRVRIVQDRAIDHDVVPEDEQGTRVTTDVLESTDDSLFPLQGALGYDIAQSLFVGPDCLVVEGVSDLLYLQVMSGILEREGRTGLDGRWTITPVGGSDKVPTFVALLGSKKSLNVTTLIDFQRRDKQAIENMWRKKLIAKKNVVTYADFLDQEEADVEDLFTEEFYLYVVSREYSGNLERSLTSGDLESPSARVIVRLEAYLQDNPMSDGARFNHYRPARFFSEKASDLQVPPDVLDRFEEVFKKVNALLK